MLSKNLLNTLDYWYPFGVLNLGYEGSLWVHHTTNKLAPIGACLAIDIGRKQYIIDRKSSKMIETREIHFFLIVCCQGNSVVCFRVSNSMIITIDDVSIS